MLDAAHQVAVAATIGLVYVVAEVLVHGGSVDNLAHVEHPIRVPTLFQLAHHLIYLVAIEDGNELASEPTVTMLTAEGALMFLDQKGSVFSHLAEALTVMLLFDIQNGSEVQLTCADVAVIDTA